MRQAAIEIAKKFLVEHEGCRLDRYEDSAGIWTIGVGHVIQNGETVTSIAYDDAMNLLERDMAQAIECVDQYVDVPLTDNESAALVSLVFNIGCKAFAGSTLLTLLNNGNYNAADAQFSRWTFAGGVPVKGLMNRRLAERELFGT